ncbi:MAG: hypothetical protein MI923_07590 [Phycisphaerales bacterium]|nr:hypothetical protein [Phycisphaerales bacterium]
MSRRSWTLQKTVTIRFFILSWSMLSVGWSCPLCVCGCMKAKEMSAVKAEIRQMEQDIGALQVKVEKKIETGGGDVNEPVTGWILAAGYSLIPVSFLGYLLAHRFKLFRTVKDRIRGAIGVAERPRSRDKNV